MLLHGIRVPQYDITRSAKPTPVLLYRLHTAVTLRDHGYGTGREKTAYTTIRETFGPRGRMGGGCKLRTMMDENAL